jgi:hypothetical protein
MAIVLLAIVVCSLLILHRLGVVPGFVFSWDLVWRIFIYILLLLGVLTVLVKTWSVVVVLARLPPRWLVSPSANPVIDVLSIAVLALALYGVWRWRKWGAWLILLRLAFTVTVQVFVYRSLHWQLFRNYTGVENLFADFSGAVVWIIAFTLTWKHFKRCMVYRALGAPGGPGDAQRRRQVVWPREFGLTFARQHDTMTLGHHAPARLAALNARGCLRSR